MGRLGMVYPLGLIESFLLSEKVIPYTTTVACSITSTRRSMESPVIDPSFIGILCFSGCDQVFSVSNGGDMEYQEFNLSCLHQQLQQRDELNNTKELSNTK
jgi:hypothetical protein